MIGAVISFVCNGPPQPKERPRLGRRGRVFTPERTLRYERAVRDVARLHVGSAWVLDGTYRLIVRAVFTDNRRRDASNVLKAVEDALNGVTWHDDTQVVECTATKVVEYGGQARTEVTVECVGEAVVRPRKRGRKAE